VMLAVVTIVKRTRTWYERPVSADSVEKLGSGRLKPPFAWISQNPP